MLYAISNDRRSLLLLQLQIVHLLFLKYLLWWWLDTTALCQMLNLFSVYKSVNALLFGRKLKYCEKKCFALSLLVYYIFVSVIKLLCWLKNCNLIYIWERTETFKLFGDDIFVKSCVSQSGGVGLVPEGALSLPYLVPPVLDRLYWVVVWGCCRPGGTLAWPALLNCLLEKMHGSFQLMFDFNTCTGLN